MILKSCVIVKKFEIRSFLNDDKIIEIEEPTLCLVKVAPKAIDVRSLKPQIQLIEAIYEVALADFTFAGQIEKAEGRAHITMALLYFDPQRVEKH